MKDLNIRIVKGLLVDVIEVFTEKVLRRTTYSLAAMTVTCGVAEGANRVGVVPTQTDVAIWGLTWTQCGIFSGIVLGVATFLLQVLLGYLKNRRESATEAARRAEESELHALDMQYARQRLLAKQQDTA